MSTQANSFNRLRKRPAGTTVAKPSIWQAIPYIENISEAVARLRQPYGVGVAHRPTGTLRNLLMKIIDANPSEQSSIMYRAQCKDCSCNYTGQASRKLATRIKEHRYKNRYTWPGISTQNWPVWKSQHVLGWWGRNASISSSASFSENCRVIRKQYTGIFRPLHGERNLVNVQGLGSGPIWTFFICIPQWKLFNGSKTVDAKFPRLHDEGKLVTCAIHGGKSYIIKCMSWGRNIMTQQTIS